MWLSEIPRFLRLKNLKSEEAASARRGVRELLIVTSGGEKGKEPEKEIKAHVTATHVSPRTRRCIPALTPLAHPISRGNVHPRPDTGN